MDVRCPARPTSIYSRTLGQYRDSFTESARLYGSMIVLFSADWTVARNEIQLPPSGRGLSNKTVVECSYLKNGRDLVAVAGFEGTAPSTSNPAGPFLKDPASVSASPPVNHDPGQRQRRYVVQYKCGLSITMMFAVSRFNSCRRCSHLHGGEA